MRRRLAGLALLLYPLAFRRRYGAEMEALLDESPVVVRTVFDLLRGAIAAHLRPADGPAGAVDDRLRASAGGVLACWVAFAAAGLAFYKTTEDAPFARAGSEHIALGTAHTAVQALAGIASVAVLAGALPLILAALRQARGDRRLRALSGAALASVAVFAGLTALLVLIAHSQPGGHPTGLGRAALAVWGVAGLACAAACLLAVRRALFATAVSRGRLVFALACGTLVTATMAAIALAAAAYAIALAFDAAGLAGSPNGPVGNPSTELTLIPQIAAMALASALATISARRGWRGLRPTKPRGVWL